MLLIFFPSDPFCFIYDMCFFNEFFFSYDLFVLSVNQLKHFNSKNFLGLHLELT